MSLSKKSLASKFDFVFIAITVVAVNRRHISVTQEHSSRWGIMAILFHYPTQRAERERGIMNQIPALVRVFAYLSLLTVGGGISPSLK